MSIPPLTALVYFNTAASHNSFKAAALEFNVTEGAISRQIKRLEQYYQQPLFVREGRGVRLTDTGRQLFIATNPALQQISQISQDILGHTPQFTLSVTSSFAIRWLMPRIAEFESLYPAFPVNLHAGKTPSHIPGMHCDASIIYALGDPYDSQTAIPDNSHFIMTEWLIPVCSPTLLNNQKPIKPKDLHQFRLIFNEITGRDWHLWLQSVPETVAQLKTAVRFEHDDTAIQAAVAGHGIALANIAYISNELTMGSLVCAVDHTPIAIGAHYLVIEEDCQKLPYVNSFKNWILQRAKQSSSLHTLFNLRVDNKESNTLP